MVCVELVISSSEERDGEIYGRSRRRLRGALRKGGNRTNKMHQSIVANRAEESGVHGERQALATGGATLNTKKDG